MDIDLNEKEIIYILNCICYTKLKLNSEKNLKEKKELMYYFNFNNFNENNFDLEILKGRLATKANKYFYKLNDENFFIGQQRYLSSKEKDFNNIYSIKIKKRK